VDRSGIGLMGELLDAHPRIAISRRTNFWSFYYQRFGDLARPQNLERCLTQIMRYTRMQALQPDREALLAALDGQPATYGRLFAAMQEQHIRRLGKRRWGDKSLDSEGHADAIFREFPDAMIVHVIRDPRDRYASQATHRRAARGRVGSGAALWRWSVRHARRNRARRPERYMLVRYEDLARRPEQTLRRVCEFVGEDFAPEMLHQSADGWHEPRPRAFTTDSIGRFRRDLSPREIALIDLVARRGMRELGYVSAGVRLSPWERLRFTLVDLPLNGVRMARWLIGRAWTDWRGPRPAARRVGTPDRRAGQRQTK
jgi:hypothetical protein